jgi:hypothetical protein
MVSCNLELWLIADSDYTYNSTTKEEWLDQSTNNLVFNANMVEGPNLDLPPHFW